MKKEKKQDALGFDKTNVMRTLDQKKINYHAYHLEEATGEMTGVEMANKLGFPVERVYKTLVTRGKSGGLHVFMIPVAAELDLKKAARAAGEKSIDMIASKELLPNTGYIHGGCSPIGMKKLYPTVLNETAGEQETIYFSAGKIGFQVEVAPADLKKLVNYTFADVVV